MLWNSLFVLYKTIWFIGKFVFKNMILINKLISCPPVIISFLLNSLTINQVLNGKFEVILIEFAKNLIDFYLNNGL